MDGYANEEWRDWKVDGASGKAGETKSFGKLTFATIRGAGHMISILLLSSSTVGGHELIDLCLSTSRMISPRRHSPWCPGGSARRRCRSRSLGEGVSEVQGTYSCRRSSHSDLRRGRLLRAWKQQQSWKRCWSYLCARLFVSNVSLFARHARPCNALAVDNP